jgi:glycosyltransferase involved in cell wall biosynthesis
MIRGISIIVCCYNSVSRLPDTIKHLSLQSAKEDIDWEVIVVDNNSTDNTSEIAIAEWKKCDEPVPLIIVKEPKPGLSHARKAGIKHAKYDLLIFCDDDNWLEKDYVEQASIIMGADSEIGILGGLNTPVSNIIIPEWFKDFQAAYACGSQAEEDGEVSKDRLYVTGAGMVIRKKIFSILDELGFESKLTDRKGEELSSGGDTEICFATALLGYKLVYSSRLRLYHFMEPKRLTWEYLSRLEAGHAKSFYKLIFYKKIYNNEIVERDWYNVLVSNLKHLLSRDGFLMLYHSFIKGDKAVGDKFNIQKRGELEVFKAHFSMRATYSNFIDALIQFSISAREKKLNLENKA